MGRECGGGYGKGDSDELEQIGFGEIWRKGKGDREGARRRLDMLIDRQKRGKMV